MENPIGFTFAPQPSTYNKQLSSPHNRIQQIITSHSPRNKRKRSPEDVDMEAHYLLDTQPSIAQASSPTSHKRTRNLPVGRPLPLPRLLDGLDKQGLQELLKNLCERHPGLTNEVYKHAPKPSVAKALSALASLERNVQTAYPFGGEVKGEYAYNRVLPHIKELLNALMDYVPHFLPPNEEHALDTLAFLDGATMLISRLPDWNNPNHTLAKRDAFEEINGAWIQGIREACKKGAGVGAAPYLDRLRSWNETSGGLLTNAVNVATEQLVWANKPRVSAVDGTTQNRPAVPAYGLFSR